MTADLVRSLTGEPLDPSLVGGKAAALNRLVAVGASVPSAAVVTTQAYRLASAKEPVSTVLRTIDAASVDEVDAAFLAVELDAETVDAISMAGAAAGAGRGDLAVRSSATAEDLSAASFAGQYRTVLGVGSTGQLLEAVRLVWASLWHPAPRAYRAIHGIADPDVAMAVIVMRQIEPELAGVAFSVDPESDGTQLRIEAVEGLGEQLVSGAVTPKVYVADRAHPGLTLPDVPPLQAVAQMALDIEEAFAAPQDVEWAWDGRTVFVVQARPITTSPLAADDGFDVLPDPAATYTRAGISEMLPGVLPPLVWDINAFALEEAFRSLFDDLAGLPESLVGARGVIGRAFGRAVLNLDMLKESAAKSPGGSADEIERQYYGEVLGAEADEPDGVGRFAHLLANLRVIRAQRRAATQAEILARAVHQVVGARRALPEATDDELLGYFHRLVDFGTRVVVNEVAVAAAAAGAYRALEILLSRWLPDEQVAQQAQVLTAGSGMTPGLDLQHLLDTAMASPEVAGVLADAPNWVDGRVRLTSSEAGREWLVTMDRTLRSAGSMAVFAGVAWPERPADAWSALVAGVGESARSSPDPEAAFAALAQRLAARPGWRRTRLLTGQVVDVRVRILRRQVADAARLLALREKAKGAVLELGGEVRRCAVELGLRLTQAGALERAGDVVYLSRAEVESAFDAAGPPLADIGRRRRWLEGLPADVALPSRFTGRPILQTPPISGDGDVLDGWAASPGRHRGRARCLTQPTGARLARGDVLVAHATDASWSPLFLRAGAVVVEEGGPLSHAAIVARELGVPAVVNVPGVVARLAGRQVDVTVDGTDGVVLIHDCPDPARPSETTSLDSIFDTLDAAAHHVFVPAALGFGMLFSIFVLMRDIVGNLRSERGLERRSTLIAHAVARGVIGGHSAGATDRTGFRSRRGYAVIAIALLSLAAYLIPGAVWNYINPVGYVKDVGWLLALSLVGIAFFLFAGVVNAVAVFRWRSLPARVRPFFVLTPLTKLDDRSAHESDAHEG